MVQARVGQHLAQPLQRDGRSGQVGQNVGQALLLGSQMAHVVAGAPGAEDGVHCGFVRLARLQRAGGRLGHGYIVVSQLVRFQIVRQHLREGKKKKGGGG